MSCCGVCTPRGHHHYGYINNPGGFKDRFDGYFNGRSGCSCHRLTPCCPPKVVTVKCITQQRECEDECNIPKVFLHITHTFARLGEGCFDLLLCPRTAEFINTKPVWLTDGKRSFPLIQAHTGDIVHYDQMAKLIDDVRRCRRRELVLKCYLGLDGPGENRVHILVRNRLPETTFVPFADISGAAEGAGFDDGFHDGGFSDGSGTGTDG